MEGRHTCNISLICSTYAGTPQKQLCRDCWAWASLIQCWKGLRRNDYESDHDIMCQEVTELKARCCSFCNEGTVLYMLFCSSITAWFTMDYFAVRCLDLAFLPALNCRSPCPVA